MSIQSESALATQCASCGGTVPIVLCAASPPCRYCGSPSPLDEAVAQRVAGVRARVAAQEARSQQLIGKQAELGRSHGVILLIVMCVLWALIFGFGWATFEPPEKLGFFELMAGGSALRSVDALALYWLTWLTMTGVGLSSVGYGASMISMRRMTRFALPRAPLVSGAPPRCRVCGAELGLQGRVRRCGYCSADHLVMGERYQREDTHLDAELARVERALDSTLEKKVQRVDRWLWVFTAVMPIVSVPVVPIAAFTLQAPPRGLVMLPLIALALGFLLVLVGSVMSVPDIRTRAATRPGDTLLVQGQPLSVAVRIRFGLWPFAGQLFLCREGGAPLEGVFVGGDEEPCYRMAFDSGGQAMSADEIERAKNAGATTPESWSNNDIDGAEALGGAYRGVTAAWYYAPSAKRPAEMHGARLWLGARPDQRPDPSPTFTVTSVLRVESDAVRLLQ